MILSVPHISVIAGPSAASALPDMRIQHPISPSVNAAVLRAARDLSAASDPTCATLRLAITSVHGISPDLILCGAGTTALIRAVILAFADEENAVLSTEHAYPAFKTACQIARAPFRLAEEINRTVSVDAILEQVRLDTRVVMIANPGNPTGTCLPRAEIRRLRDGLRGDILLVVDEACAEFTDAADDALFDLVTRGDTVILRSFSKAYGLGSHRIGWAAAPPEIAGEIAKVMDPAGLPAISQTAAAAAILDQAHLKRVRADIATRRSAMTQALRRAGFTLDDSHTDFVLLPFEGMTEAKAAQARLSEAGIPSQREAALHLPHCLRLPLLDGAALEQLLHLIARQPA